MCIELTEKRRYEIAQEFVEGMNKFSKQKGGGTAMAPRVPKEIRGTNGCTMCILKCLCLGAACRGK